MCWFGKVIKTMNIKKRIYIILDWLGIGIFLLLLVFKGGARREITAARFFVGRYQGVVVFEDQHQNIQCDTTFIEVIKIGPKTSFVFSGAIPTISKVIFEENRAKNLLNQNALDTNYIRMDTKKLEILFTEGTKRWTVYAGRN